MATRFYEAARCLFDGDDPPQIGVEVEELDAERIAIARGLVLGDADTPLEGVRVTVLGHPEFGATSSRKDGWFDMALNGGSDVTLRYEKAGYLPIQRRATVDWRDFAVFPDVVMTPVSGEATTVELDTSSGSVVEGPISDDASGTRRELLLFAPDTEALLVFSDGAMEPMDAFQLRVTEFTVGEEGPQRMPGNLPPTSAYTYAVDYRVDEAFEVDAERVDFEPPVVSYVENFLDFPAGTSVPRGEFDYAADEWRPADSGIVVALTGIEGGLAQLDTDGDGEADSDAVLADLGISDSELATLAERYEVGQSLWRVTVPHFSTWDSNWPRDLGPFAVPSLSGLGVTSPYVCPSPRPGSIIGCEDQSLGEVMSIAGTPFTLHYQSQRTEGRRDAYQARVQLSGDSIPETLKRIELELEILGQRIERSYAPATNLYDSFLWNGEDAYGRRWQGRQLLSAKVGYVYDAVYQQAARFADPGDGVPITGDPTRQEVTLWAEHKKLVGPLDVEPLRLGGWTLDVHHFYDMPSRTLFLGDGGTRTTHSISDVVDTVVGTGLSDAPGDGGPATAANLDEPVGLAIAEDGTAYISEQGQSAHRIRKVTPDGTITTIAGSAAGFSGDGGPAIDAQLYRPNGLEIGPDGSLYIADSGNGRVRKISPDGIITTVVGAGRGVSTEPVLPALEVMMDPSDLAFGPDGTLYISDVLGNYVYRLGTDGYIARAAGLGGVFDSGDGGLAIDAGVGNITSLITTQSGDVLLVDHLWSRVRQIDASGRIVSFLGDGAVDNPDGVDVAQARLRQPVAMAAAADGSLYVVTNYGAVPSYRQLYRVDPAGTVHLVAGGGELAEDGGVGDGGPAIDAYFQRPQDVAVHPDGSIWIVDAELNRVRRVRPPLPNFARGEVVIPSKDGEEVFVFDEFGRHLRTLDALHGIVRRTFEYDTAGLLVAIEDTYGNRTEIERAADGRAGAVIGPYGARSELQISDEGYLTQFSNPAGESTKLSYAEGGLLASMQRPADPVDAAHRFEYDELGRLVSDTTPPPQEPKPAPPLKAAARSHCSMSLGGLA